MPVHTHVLLRMGKDVGLQQFGKLPSDPLVILRTQHPLPVHWFFEDQLDLSVAVKMDNRKDDGIGLSSHVKRPGGKLHHVAQKRNLDFPLAFYGIA